MSRDLAIIHGKTPRGILPVHSNLVYIIYQNAYPFFKAGTSAAYADITMVCYLIFLFVKNKYLEKKVYYEN